MPIEADLYRQIQLAASKCGARLWRNNVGVLVDLDGRPVRFGLANESKASNVGLKSSDLIGITPYVIMPEHVGRIFGVFTSIEVKGPGWKYSGGRACTCYKCKACRERAQMAWIDMVRSMGGLAGFTDNSTGGIIL